MRDDVQPIPHIPQLSVVVALCNEAGNVQPLCEQLNSALQNIQHEIILVDDGSSDATVEQLSACANAKTTVILFRRNHGQSSALQAGIDLAKGKYIVTMDGDLQNDASDIPQMLALAVTGDWDVVAGRRVNRQDKIVSRKIPSKLANWLIRNLTGVRLSDYGCSLRIYKANIAKDLDLYGELHRFIPVLASMEGARMTEMDVKHHARVNGKSKYGIFRTFRVVTDLILMLFFQNYLQRPMHFFGIIGLGSFTLGVLVNAYLLVEKLIGNDIGHRPLLLLGVLLLFLGIQFITIGILMDLSMRTYYESQGKKPYRIKEIYTGADE